MSANLTKADEIIFLNDETNEEWLCCIKSKKWDEGGIYRIAMHTAIGSLGTGSIDGALTTSGIAAVAPTLSTIQENMVKTLTDKGMKADTANEQG
ncbi:hypothetical protein [Acinetobacter guillouiae]|uniref:hypothetical protein n=2 Tax=Acinetobacter guillouiae TaxID=106649 RepID=UPI0004EF688D|nr:hypothetical protein [Acinetobacter guillouiae]MBP2543779.1 hypothetical protein [Acinetobacter guillouiae]BAP36449.1 hypothetical protein AS4_15090 [Acinetobacter guillouiae]